MGRGFALADFVLGCFWQVFEGIYSIFARSTRKKSRGVLEAFFGPFWCRLGCLGVLWGVSCWPSGVPWGAFGVLWGVACWLSGVPWGALGVSWAPLGASRWSFGVPLASFGVRWVSLGGPLVPQGGLLGGSWVAFWLPWCGLVRFLVALGVSRIFLWRFRGLARNPAAKKEQSKRKRDTPTRTQHPLQNRASRSMTHRFDT